MARVHTFILCALLGSTLGGTLDAQRTIAAESSRARSDIAAETFGKLVTIRLDRVSLKHAVDAIATNAKVQIQYREDAIRSVGTPVSLHADKVSLGTALNKILAGTSLYPVATAEDLVTIKAGAAVGTATVEGVITGRVSHAKTKQPIVGATVALKDGRTQAVTGNDGAFRIVVAEGEQQVTIRAVGFVRQVRTVTVSKDAQTSVEILLEPSASVLDEVVVTGTVVATQRKAIPTPITVITAEDLERRGVTRIDQLFRGEIPGLIAIERGSLAYSNSLGNLESTQMYARGSADLQGGANPIKTYIDGVELLDPSYLGTVDPKSIERIEVITGPQAATIYGSGAMGGVMQIFTKRGNGQASQDITAFLKYGVLQSNYSNGLTPSHNDAVNLTGGVGPAFSYTAGVSYVYSGQWQPKLFSRKLGASLGATHASDRMRVSASVSTTFGENGTWNTDFGGSYGFFKNYEDGTYIYDHRTNPKVWSISQQRSTASSQTVALNFDYRQGEKLQHGVTIGRSQNRFTLTPTAPRYAGYSNDIGADSLYIASNANGQRTTVSYNTTLLSVFGVLTSTATLGGNASIGTRQNVRGCLASNSSTSMIGCSGTGSAPGVSITLDDQSWGGFARWQMGLFQQIYLTLGLRAEHNTAYGKDHIIDWTPTNGLTYTIEHGELTIKLLGSYGKATRPPPEHYRQKQVTRVTGWNVEEYVSRFEAPHLGPERSGGPQGGIELFYGNLGSLSINHYVQKVSDLIQLVVVDSFTRIRLSDDFPMVTRQTQIQNTATIRQTGWEGTGTVNISHFQLKGTYFWNDSRVLSVNPNATSTYTPGQVFTGLPTRAANITIGYANGPTTVSIVTNYMGKVWQTAFQDVTFWFDQEYARLGQYVDNYRGRTAVHIFHGAYTKTDLAMSHRISRRVSVTANITNLNNSFTSETGSLNPALGRQSMFGITIRH